MPSSYPFSFYNHWRARIFLSRDHSIQTKRPPSPPSSVAVLLRRTGRPSPQGEGEAASALENGRCLMNFLARRLAGSLSWGERPMARASLIADCIVVG